MTTTKEMNMVTLPVKNRDELVRLYGDPLRGKDKERDAWWRSMGAAAKIDSRFAHVKVHNGTKWILWKGVIWCHKDIQQLVEKTFFAIASAGLASSILTFDGCRVPRLVRGGSRPSIHAWGYAIDINAKGNGLGETPQMHPGIVKIFKEHGWIWGGDFSRKDGMHFQLVEEG